MTADNPCDTGGQCYKRLLCLYLEKSQCRTKLPRDRLVVRPKHFGSAQGACPPTTQSPWREDGLEAKLDTFREQPFRVDECTSEGDVCHRGVYIVLALAQPKRDVIVGVYARISPPLSHSEPIEAK